MIQLHPGLEDWYLSLDRYPSMDLGWQMSWLYVPNESPPLSSYSPDQLRGDLLESWEELPPLEAYRQHVPNLLDEIKDLKDQGLMGTRVIRTFIGHRVLPLKMRHHPQWEFRGPMDPTIESRVTIREDDLDQWVMKVMGEYMWDHGRGESPKAFSTDHPPPTDRPLVGMVSHPPPVPTDEVTFSCTTIHVISLH
jgi:hypothetical protein